MNNQHVIELAQKIVAANPSAYADGDRFCGLDCGYLACAHFVLYNVATAETDEVLAARNALDADAEYTETRPGYEGYSVFSDGSVATNWQAEDAAYPSLSEFYEDYPDLRADAGDDEDEDA